MIDCDRDQGVGLLVLFFNDLQDFHISNIFIVIPKWLWKICALGSIFLEKHYVNFKLSMGELFPDRNDNFNLSMNVIFVMAIHCFTGKAHLKGALNCHEEALKLHDLCKQLRKIDTFLEILKKAHDR